MSCKICEMNPVIGYNYTLMQSECGYCDASAPPMTGEYKGMDGNLHIFRIHPVFICIGCGEEMNMARYECGNSDILNVTEEFQIANVRTTSHWVGK